MYTTILCYTIIYAILNYTMYIIVVCILCFMYTIICIIYCYMYHLLSYIIYYTNNNTIHTYVCV